MTKVRCQMCGRPPEGDPEFRVRFFQHREAQKEGRVKGPMVYICPICAGRVRYESEETKGSLRKK